MKTYREGERFPGRIGRTWQDSEPAFPMPPSAPEGAPNVLCVVIDDIGFGWTEPFGWADRHSEHPADCRQRDIGTDSHDHLIDPAQLLHYAMTRQ